MRKRTTPSHLAGTRRISRPAPAWSCHALADMSGAQLWMGRCPRNWTPTRYPPRSSPSAPRPTAVALRRSTYQNGGASGDAPVGFALVDFASAEDASIALDTCANATFGRAAPVPHRRRTPPSNARRRRIRSTLDAGGYPSQEDPRRVVVHTRGRRRARESNPRRREPRRAARPARLRRTPRAARRAGRRGVRRRRATMERRRRAGLARLRLVERLCAARRTDRCGVNAHDGNRTRDDSTRDARRRVWTKADRRQSPSLFLRDSADDACLTELGSETIPGTRRTGDGLDPRYPTAPA